MRTFAITTFGCQMNVHDSDRMRELLEGAGLEAAADEASADVVVLNTCSVREKAEQKLLSEVGRLAARKRERPELVVVVAGCVAQQEGEKLVKSGRGIDLVIGPDNYRELPGLLEELELGSMPLVRAEFDNDAPHFLEAKPGALAARATAFVTTMKGCDERCSFCIVPTTRGTERYRPAADVIAEVARLCAAGVREVTLLGQTVNSYRDEAGALEPAPGFEAGSDDDSHFAALLRAIAARVPELERLRYTSPHPRHLVPSLVRAHAELPVLARHVHLPVQSGSDRMLRRMIRRYTRAEYVARVNTLRAAVPALTLSTDVIVGFPGETDADFDATLSLVAEVGFVGVFGFKYSPRPGTPALKLGDDVPEAVKSARLTRLFELSERLVSEHLATLVGSRQRVLVEGGGRPSAKRAPRPTGRTERNEITHLVGLPDGAEDAITGRTFDVTVTRANKHSLEAELAPADLADVVAAVARLREAPGPAQRPRRSLPMQPTLGEIS